MKPMEGIEVMYFKTKGARKEYMKKLAPKYLVVSVGKLALHNAPPSGQYKLVLFDTTKIK